MTQDTKQMLWLGSLLLLLASVSMYFGRYNFSYLLDAETLSQMTDMEIKNVWIDEFNAKGYLTRHLEAATLRHLPLHQQWLFQQPYLIFHASKQEEGQWQLKAARAKSQGGFEQVIFQDHVQLTQIRPDGKPGPQLYTQELIYLAKQARVWTQKPITIQQDGNTMLADGMQVNLNNHHINLQHVHLNAQSPKPLPRYHTS